MTAYGPTLTPEPSRASGWMMAVGWSMGKRMRDKGGGMKEKLRASSVSF
jgi:hypothetical protein